MERGLPARFEAAKMAALHSTPSFCYLLLAVPADKDLVGGDAPFHQDAGILFMIGQSYHSDNSGKPVRFRIDRISVSTSPSGFAAIRSREWRADQRCRCKLWLLPVISPDSRASIFVFGLTRSIVTTASDRLFESSASNPLAYTLDCSTKTPGTRGLPETVTVAECPARRFPSRQTTAVPRLVNHPCGTWVEE